MDEMLGHHERSREFELEQQQQALSNIDHEEGAGKRIERIYERKLAARCESKVQ